MRHGRKFNHLGRNCSQRKALLKSLAVSLIKHKKIVTTLAKAKALRVFIEPLLTLSKTDTTHCRRLAFSKLMNKEACKELFNNISGRISDRNGGYTRIIKLGNRFGDGGDVALIMFVDYKFDNLDKKDDNDKQ